MSPEWIWKNVVAYCMQVGLLIGLAAFVPAVLRLRMPRAKLAYWQVLLVVCLALPMGQTWQREVIDATVQVSSVVTAVAPAGAPATPRVSAIQIALLLLVGGALVRLAWLSTGFCRLWRYRQRSRGLAIVTRWKTHAEIRISRDVSSPVTFGFRRPVVLVPATFTELDARTQDAILCHELLHVERRDWLFTVAEEVVRAVFWFHPAIWWLLGEIQLSREQAVDREVIEMTQSRDEYVDALLAIAGAKPRLDLAPAPLFLRRRHLKQRVVSILKDARMSRTGLASAFAVCLGILAAGCWLVTNTFPLAAAPQVIAPPQPPPAPRAQDVQPSDTLRSQNETKLRAAQARQREVEMRRRLERERAAKDLEQIMAKEVAAAPEPQRLKIGGNVQQTKLVSQTRPVYPPAAKQARIQGVVKLSAIIGKDGTVQQLEVLSGHPLLVPASLEAVKEWVYEPTLLNGNPVEVVTQIDINYTLAQ